jgi:ABC-type phosphate/phosphonate transport system permease subunit
MADGTAAARVHVREPPTPSTRHARCASTPDVSAFNTLLAVALVVVNLAAVGAAVTARAESAARLRAWARGLVASSLGMFAIAVVAGTYIAIASPALEDEPTARAPLLAQAISEAMNGVAMAIVGVVLPLLVALAFGLRASRKASSEG